MKNWDEVIDAVNAMNIHELTRIAALERVRELEIAGSPVPSRVVQDGLSLYFAWKIWDVTVEVIVWSDNLESSLNVRVPERVLYWRWE